MFTSSLFTVPYYTVLKKVNKLELTYKLIFIKLKSKLSFRLKLTPHLELEPNSKLKLRFTIRPEVNFTSSKSPAKLEHEQQPELRLTFV